ncbi:STAS domain-containing protein [Pseudomonas sp. HK3]|jgi:anti-anti-sigma factor
MMSIVSVDNSGGVLQIAIKGRFDFNILEEFRDAYSEKQGAGDKFVVDLAQTEYIDSSALGMLLNMKNHLGAEDRQIEIKNCQPNLMKIFSIAHFDKKFKFI